MPTTLRILVVAPTPELAHMLSTWLADHHVVVANSYAVGKRELSAVPDILITEYKLGAYNGLHLALRAQDWGIPTLVLGPFDRGFAHETDLVGARYVLADLVTREQLLNMIDNALDGASDSPISTIVAAAALRADVRH